MTHFFILLSGILTGKCVFSDMNETINVCEIRGWCPVERDVNPLYVVFYITVLMYHFVMKSNNCL